MNIFEKMRAKARAKSEARRRERARSKVPTAVRRQVARGMDLAGSMAMFAPGATSFAAQEAALAPAPMPAAAPAVATRERSGARLAPPPFLRAPAPAAANPYTTVADHLAEHDEHGYDAVPAAHVEEKTEEEHVYDAVPAAEQVEEKAEEEQVYDAVPAAEQAEEEHVYDAVPAAAAREEAAAVEPEVAPAENAYDLHHAAAPALAPAPGAAAAAPAITPAGPGVSHASPELLAEQAQLRALAAEVKTAGWQAVDPAQARWGWAITGMHQHGVDFDTKLAKDTVKYHSDTERGEHLLALRDGKLAYAHGDTELKSDLTAENARARMPRLFMEHMKEQFVALLEGKGLKSEATQVRGLDAAIGARAIAMFGKLGGADKAMVDGFARAADEKVAASGRLIFAMNQSGQIFAGNGFATIVHHSTFLAGGPVACAGELAVSGGAIKAISNNSGHYRPGPAHLWQAVRQLAMDGVDVAGVDVEVQLAGTLKGADFLANLSPLRPKDDPGFLSFDPVTGAAAVRRYLTGA